MVVEVGAGVGVGGLGAEKLAMPAGMAGVELLAVITPSGRAMAAMLPAPTRPTKSRLPFVLKNMALRAFVPFVSFSRRGACRARS